MMFVLLYMCYNISVYMYMFEKVKNNYMHMSAYVYMCASTCVYMCMHVYVYVYICVWVCMCAQMFVHQHIDIYAVHILCIYEEKISMHVCICEYICACV